MAVRLNWVCTVPVLGLDELSRAPRTGWQMEVITELLDARYRGNLTTLLTSNLDPDGLKEAFGGSMDGERVVSRMAEWCPMVGVGGPDLRVTHA